MCTSFDPISFCEVTLPSVIFKATWYHQFDVKCGTQGGGGEEEMMELSLKLRLGILFAVDRNLTENIWFWPVFAAQIAVSQLTSEQRRKKKT